MTAILAVTFPALVALVSWKLLRPDAALRNLPSRPHVDRSPVPLRTHLAWSVTYLLLSVSLGALLAGGQHALFVAARSTSWRFSARTTDLVPYACVVGLFLGMIVSIPLVFRSLRRHYGDRLADLLDREGLDSTRLSLRQEFALSPKLAAGVALLLVCLNLAAFDTFIHVGNGVFRFSRFFSPKTYQYPVGQIRELVVHLRHFAPSGAETKRSALEIRMRDGTAIDTFSIIEDGKIPDLISALQTEAGGRLPVERTMSPRMGD